MDRVRCLRGERVIFGNASSLACMDWNDGTPTDLCVGIGLRVHIAHSPWSRCSPLVALHLFVENAESHSGAAV